VSDPGYDYDSAGFNGFDAYGDGCGGFGADY
jgi:hypothetical protein